MTPHPNLMGVVLYAFYYFNMKIVIINISQIIKTLIPKVQESLRNNHNNYKVEDCIDFCIFKSFNNVFCLAIADTVRINSYVA